MKTISSTTASAHTSHSCVRGHKLQKVRGKFRIRASGFTLIELMVSLGIFSIVMVIAASSYLSVIATSQYSQSSAKVVNSLANVLNDISNEIRNGSCGSGLCSTGTGSSFSFKNADGETVTYDLSDNTITREVGSDPKENLTNPKNVNVTKLNFWVSQYTVAPSVGAAAGQYWIDITVSGKPPANNKSTIPVYLETGVTLRQLTIQ